MITIQCISQVNYSEYDEVWAIVRSLKYGNSHVRHVPELSPSWSLFQQHLQLRKDGQWNEETFQKIYVPQFLKEMQGSLQQRLLNELFATRRRICLVCFCPEEALCHRSIIGGMLQGAGADVRGLSRDYSDYFEQYKKAALVRKTDKKLLEELNRQVRYLYDPKVFAESLSDRASNLKTLCATGHRPKGLCGYDRRNYQNFVSDLTDLLYHEFYGKRGIRRFISGGAQGFDQLFFWAVHQMKKRYSCMDPENIVFVPFEGQEDRWSETGCFSKTEYRMMLKQADQIVVVSKEYTVEALPARNHAMCDCSGSCLALCRDEVWELDENAVRGSGTMECLRYAKANGLKRFRLNYSISPAGLHAGGITPAENE